MRKRRARRNGGKSHHNIESSKSPFGNYRIGYGSNGVVFKITGSSGYFVAEPAPNVPANKGKPYNRLTASTLSGLSKKLSALSASNPRRGRKRRRNSGVRASGPEIRKVSSEYVRMNVHYPGWPKKQYAEEIAAKYRLSIPMVKGIIAGIPDSHFKGLKSSELR